MRISRAKATRCVESDLQCTRSTINLKLIAYAHCELPAHYISAHMLSSNAKQTLNELSHSCAVELIKHALARGINVKRAFIDTVGTVCVVCSLVY